jgi:glycosyltransferase involved in cell wall biosynthesis
MFNEKLLWDSYSELHTQNPEWNSPEKLKYYARNSNEIFHYNKGVSPKVAVCVIAHNEEKYLARTLHGLNDALALYPNIPPTEIIVVDNASTDSTANVADAFHAKVVSEPNKGIGHARQTGLLSTQSSVEQVLTTDADCVISNYWIFRNLVGLNEPNVVCTYGRAYYRPDQHRVSLKDFIFSLFYQMSYLHREFKTHVLNRHMIGGGNMGYLKNEALESGGYNTSLLRGEDTDLYMRLRRFGRVLRIDAPVLVSDRRIRKMGFMKKLSLSLLENASFYTIGKDIKGNRYLDYREN